MFHGMNCRRQLVDVAALIWHGPLCYDTAAVECLVNVMYRSAVDLDSELQRLLYGMCPLKGWQQRRMQVDDAAAIGFQKCRADDAHIPRKAYQLDTRSSAASYNLTLELCLRGIILRREYKTVDAHMSGNLADTCPGLVANHKYHLGVDTPFGRSLGYGLEIGSVAAGKDRYFVFSCHRPLLYGYTLAGYNAADNRCVLAV